MRYERSDPSSDNVVTRTEECYAKGYDTLRRTLRSRLSRPRLPTANRADVYELAKISGAKGIIAQQVQCAG